MRDAFGSPSPPQNSIYIAERSHSPLDFAAGAQGSGNASGETRNPKQPVITAPV
jgi:hypothetical protein